MSTETPLDLKRTVNLPKTAFGQKANLAQSEPARLKKWTEMGLYEMIQRERAEPLLKKVTELSEQGKQIAVQGKEIAEQINTMSGHLSTATLHFSESVGIIKEEVRELKLLVGETAETARDKVALVSNTIDKTHQQVTTTTTFIRNKVIQPARELAAIMAGFRRGLEVLVAPAPKPVNQTYGEDEMFIG